MTSGKRLPVAFFRTDAGAEPVRDWLRSADLTVDDRRRIGEDVKTVEFGWPVGMPLARSLGDGLWEVRTVLKDRTARIIFCTHAEHMVLLHGFLKKSQKTPAGAITLARQRQRKLERKE